MTHTSPTPGPDETAAARTAQVEALKSEYAAALAGRGEQIPHRPSRRPLIARLVLHGFNLLIAVGAFAAYQHFHLQGQSTAALVSLGVAGVFAFAPVRALLRDLLTLESRALHLAHGIPIQSSRRPPTVPASFAG